MINAKEVEPGKWHNAKYPIRILYDNDEYSVIWGKYDGNKALATRWNGYDDGIGYPQQGGNPLWFVQPSPLAISILHYLLTLATDPEKKVFCDFPNIEYALKEVLNELEND